MAKNFLDRFISFISPKAAAQRARFRNIQQVFEDIEKRRYEGAGQSRRTSGWIAGSTGPNAEIAGGLVRLRNRSRDLVRNNPYAARAIQAIASNVVGHGIVPRVQDDKVRELWESWGESSDCDASGCHNIYGLQNQIMREIAESGEVLIRKRIRRKEDGLAVPLQLQIIEADHLDDTKDQTLQGGGVIKQGIEFDFLGRRVAYWLHKEHPGESGISYTTKSVRVPADEVLHLFRADRAGQIRGVPWGSPVLLKLKDFDEYEDAQLVRQKIAACFAGFISDTEQPLDSTNNDAILDEKMEPGSFHVLPPGKEISFGTPPTVGADYEPYTRVTLRAVATGFGVTYEVLTQDYSNVNFSSGRMGWIEFQRNLHQWRWLMLIPGFCEPIWKWFIEAAELVGRVKPNAQMIKSEWTAPKREMIDPTKETAADLAAVRAGFKTLSSVILEQGIDPETHFEALAADNEKIKKYRLKLDSDANTMNSSGAFQTTISNNGEDQNGKARSTKSK